jgi:signal transduction histidine kinase
MRPGTKSRSKHWSPYRVPFLVRHLSAGSRYSGILLLMVATGVVAVVGFFVIRDLQASNMEAQIMYTGAVRGLQRIGELQYDIQETRRATLYALTTSDSNLQVEYADQSRAADLRVRNGIAEYALQANEPGKLTLATRLNLDWTNYLHFRDEVLASILEGSTKDAVSLDLTGGVPAFEKVRQDLSEVKRLYEQDAAERLNNLVSSSNRSRWRLIAILMFTFLLSLAAVWVIQRGQMLSAIQLAKLQMEFVASVSHELRTPLAVLSSASDNLADGLILEKSALRNYGAVLQHQSRRMSTLVDQILLFASTEDRRNRYVLQSVDVTQVIDSVLNTTAELANNDGFVIERDIQPDLPLVQGDPLGISQCLQNLIGNAVKYSGDERRIAVRGNLSAAEYGHDSEVRISVIDSGIGIDRSELTRIFEPFYRSPRVNNLQIHGTGLGLSLAQRIAEAMGGRITVSSGLSIGSTFVLHLQTVKGEDLPTAVTEAQNARR